MELGRKGFVLSRVHFLVFGDLRQRRVNPRVHLSEKGVKTARESECGKTMGARFRARLPSYPVPFHLSSPEFSNPFPPFDPPSSIFTRRDAGE